MATSTLRASRRHALKLLGAGALALAAPAIICRSPARAQTATAVLMDGPGENWFRVLDTAKA